MFGAASNTNKFCTTTGGPVLASGEHVTGGLVGGGPQLTMLAAGPGRFAQCTWSKPRIPETRSPPSFLPLRYAQIYFAQCNTLPYLYFTWFIF